MTERPQPPDVQLQLTVLDGDIIEVYLREGMTQGQLAARLRQIADGFDQQQARRIR